MHIENNAFSSVRGAIEAPKWIAMCPKLGRLTGFDQLIGI